MADRYGKENLTQFRIDAKIGASAATGIKAEGLSVGIGVLDKIAKEFKVSTWQLLAEDLGADLFKLEEKRVVPIRIPPRGDSGYGLGRTKKQKGHDPDKKQGES